MVIDKKFAKEKKMAILMYIRDHYLWITYHVMSGKTKILLSTDSLGGYWLDYIFTIAKKCKFEGLELAMRKNFDAQNPEYVKALAEKHNIKVYGIQTSASLNKKEMNKALDLCEELNCNAININAPRFFNYKTFNFIKNNLPQYIKKNKDIHFSIINPEDTSFFMIPVPKYRFSNLVEIIKKYGSYLALDIANLDEDAFEDEFYRKMEDFLPYINTIYLSDKDKNGKAHIIPWEWVLKLPSFLKKLKEKKYNNTIAIKINISKADLADHEKTEIILKKTVQYYKEHFSWQKDHE